eukprot:Rhum_TRINITY_DN11445_c0_g2::Rhum_TRINITY_DN11445_c0_g2_i1::g.44460::m.44460
MPARAVKQQPAVRATRQEPWRVVDSVHRAGGIASTSEWNDVMLQTDSFSMRLSLLDRMESEGVPRNSRTFAHVAALFPSTPAGAAPQILSVLLRLMENEGVPLEPPFTEHALRVCETRARARELHKATPPSHRTREALARRLAQPAAPWEGGRARRSSSP